MMIVYLAGAALLTLRLLVGMIRASRIVRRARPVDLLSTALRLPAGTRIVESAEVLVPVTIGCRRPAVVLPADWKTWSDASLAMVLAHEGEHVRRGDTWVAPPGRVELRRLLVPSRGLACPPQACRPGGAGLRRRRDPRHRQPQGIRAEPLGDGGPVDGRLRADPAGRRGDGPNGECGQADRGHSRQRSALVAEDRRGGALLLACIVAPLVFLAAGLRPAAPTDAAEPPTAAIEGGKPAEAKPSAAGLKGRVVMADDGKPVAGAEVRLLTWTDDGVKTKPVTTNAKGQFEFNELAEGRYTLAAYYHSLTSRDKIYHGYEAKAGEDSIVLKLHEAPSLKVKVVARADGKPIQGATVRLVWDDAKRDHFTDASGEVLINGLTPQAWTIEALAKGFAVDKQAVHLSGIETASVTAELAPGAELFGVVRDEAGKGLPGVGMNVFPAGMNGEQIAYMKTDADGKYRFEYLPIAGLSWSLSKVGYADFRPNVAITAAPGGRQELDLTLPRRPDGGSVRGTVVNKDGKPIEGASVVNRGSSSDELRETKTDAQGRFRLDNVFSKWGSVGLHELFIKAKRFAPQQLEFKPGNREHPAELNVTLAAGHRVRGRVVDEQGQALAGVHVYYAHGNQFPGSDFGGGTTTDAEGRFEFDSLPAEPPFALRKEGCSPMEDVKLPLDGEKEVTVAMRSAGVIRGRVVDDKTGKPVSPFMVRVTSSPDRKPDDPSGSSGGDTTYGGDKFATRDGTFRIGEFVRDMPLQVTVEAEGYDRTVVRRVVAVADSDAKPVEFRLAPIDPSSLLTIAGRLVDEQSRPRAGATGFDRGLEAAIPARPIPLQLGDGPLGTGRIFGPRAAVPGGDHRSRRPLPLRAGPRGGRCRTRLLGRGRLAEPKGTCRALVAQRARRPDDRDQDTRRRPRRN